MSSRSVSAVVPASSQLEGAGMVVHRTFPGARLDMVDPFLLLDELGPADFGPGEAPGFPDHPHRGFETVTYMLDGVMEHRDSAGHRGVVGPGDVQWMTAGSGLVHSEMPDSRGGPLHGFQLWVNLPAADKMSDPRYQELSAAEIPEWSGDGARVNVLAGAVGDVAGRIETHLPITYLHVRLDPGAAFTQPVPAALNAFVYLSDGSVSVGGEDVAAKATLLLDGDGDEVAISAGGDGADLLLLAGQPLREPVARYGPFVMNTKAELAEAVDDYQAGRMGVI
ncbi:MAG: pirin family protein [Acidimicrobiia bacterium]|nr:pirin family protein [Acidimicrobiia bacterium]